MNNWVLVILGILLSAFFSGVEIAFVTANRLEIELAKKQGNLSGRILGFLQERSSEFIGAMLIGNNICLVIYGIAIAEIIEPQLFQVYPNSLFVFISQTILSTILILVTGEFLPKSIFKNNANSILVILSPFMYLAYFILYIPSKLLTEFANIAIKIFKGGRHNTTVSETRLGRIDLDNYLKEITDNKSEREIEHEVQIFQNALDFSSLKARECMIPRTELIAIDIEESMEELKKMFIKTKLSKILVYRENIDNIIGYIHSFELFKYPKNIKSILLPIFVVPESMPANKVMETFIKKQKSLAIVVDELGGTSGLITIEDVVEEIVGDIDDEHDLEEMIEKKLDENNYIFSARLDVDYINEKFDLGLPNIEGVETLGGLIIHACENIPDEGEKIGYPPFQFEILAVHESKIDLVKIHILD